MVRRAIAALVLFVALAWVVPTACRAEGINWHKSLEEALKASETSGKLVMLTLHTDWCGFCDMLENQTWPAEAVIKKSAEFECASVNPEKTEVRGGYDNEEYPRTLFLRSDGEIVREVDGFAPPDEFVEEMTRAQGDLLKLNEVEEIGKKLRKPEDDLALAARAGILCAEIGRAREAVRWLSPAYEHLDQLPEDQRAETALAYGLSLSMDLQYEKALPVLREFVEKHPDHPRAREARFALGIALFRTDKLADARDVWKKLVEDKSDDWIAEAATHNIEVVNQALANP